MKLCELKGWPQKIKGALLEISRWQGYNDALSQVGEMKIELDVEKLASDIDETTLGTTERPFTTAEWLATNLKSILKVKGKK